MKLTKRQKKLINDFLEESEDEGGVAEFLIECGMYAANEEVVKLLNLQDKVRLFIELHDEIIEKIYQNDTRDDDAE